MKICILKYNSRIIEMQSHATAGTLIQNAINSGYAIEDIEEKEIAEPEYKVLFDAQTEAEKTYVQRRIAEYPPMVDYIDAIVKGDEVQRQAYIDKCLAIKARYPKIEENLNGFNK